jgi:hypothetical protein
MASLGSVLLARVSGGDGLVAAEADERIFEAVHEVTVRYKDAPVADLHGGCAAPRVRVEVSDYELEIAGVRLAIKYEYGGRGLTERAPSGDEEIWVGVGVLSEACLFIPKGSFHLLLLIAIVLVTTQRDLVVATKRGPCLVRAVHSL